MRVSRWPRTVVSLVVVGGLCLGSQISAAAGTGAVVPHHRDQLALTQFVDPRIGTAVNSASGYAGNVNAGAQVPFGAVTFGPDMPRKDFNGSGGYLIGANATSGNINFFSMTHLSGVGCPGQGAVAMMPRTAATPLVNGSNKVSPVGFKTATETAKPGYYEVGLDTGVNAEFTATQRTGMARFTFPDADQGFLALDLRANARTNQGGSVSVKPENVSLQVSDDGRTISGKTVAPAFCTPYGTKWNAPVYFYGELDKPLRAQADGSSVNTVTNGGGVFQYDLTDTDRTLTMRTGISSVSVANARLNLDAENPDGAFDAVAADADQDWNERLNTVQVDRAADPAALSAAQRDDLVQLYSALYRVFGSPTVYSDVNGDFRSMEAQKPYPSGVDATGGVEDRPVANVADYDYTRPDGSTGSYSTQYTSFSMWDTYRSQAQLLALLAPKESAEMMQSLVVDAQQCGAFPHWVDGSDDSTPMAGDNALPVIAGAKAFGVDDFDLVTAGALVKQSVFDPTSTCNDHASMSGAEQYLRDGYYPDASSANIERYNSDRAAAAFLADLPQDVKADPRVTLTDADLDALTDRAGWWRTIFDTSTGTIKARKAPTTPGEPGAWTTGSFHESTEPNYFWSFGYAWSDLVAASGGKDVAVERLNRLFSVDDALTAKPTLRQLNGGQESQGLYIGNEPAHAAPWAYNWAGKPAATQYVVQQIMDTAFTTRRDGLPGNDDMGATSSWYVFAALGMFPTVGTAGGVALSTPQFPATTMWLGNKPLRITTSDDAHAAPFVQSLRMDDRDYAGSWLPISKVRRGVTLDFTVGATASQWAAADALAPPSGPDANYEKMTARGK
ncbi:MULTISPECIES: glycoside hydrolase domain-containing protein [unclassified Isoptericola]|uniref:glycoside hydrolase domain-containing protein n=1 Tax=unclassified Isoptericola TaxID=2623355 RepID=UPI003663FAA5